MASGIMAGLIPRLLIDLSFLRKITISFAEIATENPLSAIAVRPDYNHGSRDDEEVTANY